MNNRWHFYCEGAYDCMNARLYRWRIPGQDVRNLTRIYYSGVFDCGNPHHTGLISERAYNNILQGKKITHDHYLSPQFASGVPLHFYDKYLCPQNKDPRGSKGDRDNFDNFCEYMNCLRVVVRVTKKENKELSKLTDTDSGDFPIIHVPTHKKYDHLGIKLYKFDTTKQLRDNVIEEILDTQLPESASEVLHFPTDLIEYEKDFLTMEKTW